MCIAYKMLSHFLLYLLENKPERLTGKARIWEWGKEVNVGAVAF